MFLNFLNMFKRFSKSVSVYLTHMLVCVSVLYLYIIQWNILKPGIWEFIEGERNKPKWFLQSSVWTISIFFILSFELWEQYNNFMLLTLVIQEVNLSDLLRLDCVNFYCPAQSRGANIYEGEQDFLHG